MTGGGVAVLAAAVVAVVLLTGGHQAPANVTPGALITTFQTGELRQVPIDERVGELPLQSRELEPVRLELAVSEAAVTHGLALRDESADCFVQGTKAVRGVHRGCPGPVCKGVFAPLWDHAHYSQGSLRLPVDRMWKHDRT